MKKGLNHIKLKAFTLPELIVTMILVLLLFLLASEAYSISVRQVSQIQKKYSFYTEDYIEEKVLQQDFEKADLIKKNTDGTVALYSQKKTIYYSFDSGYILRQTKENIDTLLPGGMIVTTKYYQDTSSLVNYLTIRHFYQGKRFYTFLSKQYSAEQILHYYFTENKEDE